jgi:hypothetical protein
MVRQLDLTRPAFARQPWIYLLYHRERRPRGSYPSCRRRKAGMSKVELRSNLQSSTAASAASGRPRTRRHGQRKFQQRPPRQRRRGTITGSGGRRAGTAIPDEPLIGVWRQVHRCLCGGLGGRATAGDPKPVAITVIFTLPFSAESTTRRR